jgi:hypothetical protein
MLVRVGKAEKEDAALRPVLSSFYDGVFSSVLLMYDNELLNLRQ